MKRIQIEGFWVESNSVEELKGLEKEIFRKNIYWVELENMKPRILDIGAHVGLASLYFKKTYPGSRILAIEPFGPNYEKLLGNIEMNNIGNIETRRVAVSASGGVYNMYFDRSKDRWYSTAGRTRGGWDRTQESDSIKVDSVKLSELLSEHEYDLVKIDIEGEEVSVIKQASDKLNRVGNIVIEYHPVDGNSLDVLVRLLKVRGFEVEVWGENGQINPRRWKKMAIVKGLK